MNMDIQKYSPNLPSSDATELAIAERQMAVMQEIQGAMVMAKKFPRDERQVFSDVVSDMGRKTMALSATYKYKRGGTEIKGPSVKLARAIARRWGNLRWGTEVIGDDGEHVTIESFAWDVQDHNKKTMQDRFSKLVQRKVTDANGEQITKWVVPDERDLRELINRRAAINERNCMLQIFPADLVEVAMTAARNTVENQIDDPKKEEKRLVLEFRKLGVSAKQLNDYVGSETWGIQDIADLQEVLTSIQEGNSSRDEYFRMEGAAEKKATESKVKSTILAKAEEIKTKASGPKVDPTPEEIAKGELFE